MKKYFLSCHGDYIEGRNSEYNLLDIFWFIFVWKPILFRLAYTSFPITWPIDDNPGIKCLRRMSKGYRHIASPLTIAYHRLFSVPIIYYECPPCEWTQFLKMKCNKCGIDGCFLAGPDNTR